MASNIPEVAEYESVQKQRILYTTDEIGQYLLKAGAAVAKETNQLTQLLDRLTEEAALNRTISARQWARTTGRATTSTAKDFNEARKKDAKQKAEMRAKQT